MRESRVALASQIEIGFKILIFVYGVQIAACPIRLLLKVDVRYRIIAASIIRQQAFHIHRLLVIESAIATKACVASSNLACGY